MLSMFKAVTGGDSWGPIYDAMHPVSILWGAGPSSPRLRLFFFYLRGLSCYPCECSAGASLYRGAFELLLAAEHNERILPFLSDCCSPALATTVAQPFLHSP